jgi:hypothetical protein
MQISRDQHSGKRKREDRTVQSRLMSSWVQLADPDMNLLQSDFQNGSMNRIYRYLMYRKGEGRVLLT